MRGEAVAERVRAHALAEAGAAGVALDDLVEPLTREAPAAAVEEHRRLRAGGPAGEQRGAPGAGVGEQCGHRLAPDRTDPLLRALSACAQQAFLEIDVGELEPDGLRGAQPAR